MVLRPWLIELNFLDSVDFDPIFAATGVLIKSLFLEPPTNKDSKLPFKMELLLDLPD